MKLPDTHPLAPAWAALVAAAGTDLRPDAQPWEVYELLPPPKPWRAVPPLPGPKIYAVPEGLGWYYAGQTRQPLPARLADHLRRRDRRLAWPGVMALRLRDEVSANRLDQLENTARVVLRPTMGSRWPSGT